jgi:hypothetical protein
MQESTRRAPGRSLEGCSVREALSSCDADAAVAKTAASAQCLRTVCYRSSSDRSSARTCTCAAGSVS